jgi:hypothetical protein
VISDFFRNLFFCVGWQKERSSAPSEKTGATYCFEVFITIYHLPTLDIFVFHFIYSLKVQGGEILLRIQGKRNEEE